jgi:hypothetical protein
MRYSEGHQETRNPRALPTRNRIAVGASFPERTANGVGATILGPWATLARFQPPRREVGVTEVPTASGEHASRLRPFHRERDHADRRAACQLSGLHPHRHAKGLSQPTDPSYARTVEATARTESDVALQAAVARPVPHPPTQRTCSLDTPTQSPLRYRHDDRRHSGPAPMDLRGRGDARGEVTPGSPLSLQNMVSEHICSDPHSHRHERQNRDVVLALPHRRWLPRNRGCGPGSLFHPASQDH